MNIFTWIQEMWAKAYPQGPTQTGAATGPLAPQTVDTTVDTTVAGAQAFGSTFVFFLVVALGLVIAADYAPRLVNGVLILILIGILLRNAGPISSALQNAGPSN